jgi:uncharacterized heparinase superfamily protein
LNPDWLRDLRRQVARISGFSLTRVPDAPAHPARDPWPGDVTRGANLLKGELAAGGASITLRPGDFDDLKGPESLLVLAHSFTWLRDLRALGTDGARMRARALVAEWIATSFRDRLPERPDVMGARIAAWLGHYDFFAASADDGFRQKLMARLVADAKMLSAALPAEALDARALTAVKGLVAAAVALPDHNAFLSRALRLLPQEIGRQILPDGMHCERSPAQHMAALQDLTEIRAWLQAAQATPPTALQVAIERMSPALRMLRHGDGGLALVNGTKEETATLVEQVLAQAGRAGRVPQSLPDGGFQRLQAGRSTLLMDCGAPAPPKLDRLAHAGTLAFELSIGRERLIVNCGAAPAAGDAWRDACRATAAHSTLIIADTNSSELRPIGLARRPEIVEVSRQDSQQGAFWLDASHDGYRRPFGAIHRRRLYMSESGEDIRGEDVVESTNPHSFAVRFHLHPTVDASTQQDGETVLLRLPSGGGWRLRAEGARIGIEESIYLGGAEPRRCEQVVLTAFADGPQVVKWGLMKIA